MSDVDLTFAENIARTFVTDFSNLRDKLGKVIVGSNESSTRCLTADDRGRVTCFARRRAGWAKPLTGGERSPM